MTRASRGSWLLRRSERHPPAGRRVELLAAGAAATVIVAIALVDPSRAGLVMVVLALAAVTVAMATRAPVLAVLLLVVASFLRAAVSLRGLPEPYGLAVVLAVMAAGFAVMQGRLRAPTVGPVEVAMMAYIGVNLLSWLLPHEYPPLVASDGTESSVARYIFLGTVFPFVAYVLGRIVLCTEQAHRRLAWLLVGLTAYSATVSVLQLRGPRSLVWPRYIVTRPSWPNRAVGIFNQPVVNGLVLVVGIAACLFLVHHGGAGRQARVVLYGVAALSGYGVYLTHTRAAWLMLAVVLLAGIVLGTGGHRRDCTVATAFIGLVVLMNWATFIGRDRGAGGVGSNDEVADRLNMIATGLWAVGHRPILGWGIGRFASVNTDHHQQWDPSVDWRRGYGLVAHDNEIGIATDLGLVGLALWVAVLVLVIRRVWTARQVLLSASGERGAAMLALVGLLGYVVVGSTVDLRFLDFANGLVFLLAGATVGMLDRRSPEPTVVPGTQPRPSDSLRVVR